MQIVIEIDKETYKEIKKIVANGNEMCFMQTLIANGTPLSPHGRLIDEDQIPGDSGWDFSDRLMETPTIIEANKESEEV